MKRSWAYVVNGYRMKLLNGSAEEKNEIRKLAEQFFAAPPQHLPIVEVKDNATSTTIEVCKIVQTANYLHLIKSGLSQPKLLQEAEEWLLLNGYESKSLRALTTVLSCLDNMAQNGWGNPVEYAQGKLTILRSAFQQIISLGTVDKETGSLGSLLSCASALYSYLSGLKSTCETVGGQTNCSSDDEFFAFLRKGVVSEGYLAKVVLPFLNSQFPSAVAHLIEQHQKSWLSLEDGLSTMCSTIACFPAEFLPRVWGQVVGNIPSCLNTQAVSAGSALSVIDALTATQSAEYPPEILKGHALIVEEIMRWVSRTAASDFIILRDFRRLFQGLSYLFGSKGNVAKQLDVRELHRLIDLLRPRMLQLFAMPNTHPSEISMIAAALGRCQQAILSQHDAGVAVIHVDLIRSLISAMLGVRNAYSNALLPFFAAICQIIVREWKTDKLRPALSAILISRKVLEGRRAPQPLMVRLLQLIRESADDNLSSDLLCLIVYHTSRLQTLIEEDQSVSLLDSLIPLIKRLELEQSKGASRLPSNLSHFLAEHSFPQLEQLKLAHEQFESAHFAATQNTSESAAPLTDLLGKIDAAKTYADVVSIIKASVNWIQQDNNDDEKISARREEFMNQIVPKIIPLLSQHTAGMQLGDLCIAFQLLKLSESCEGLLLKLFDRSIALVEEKGNILGKSRLLQAVASLDLAPSVIQGKVNELLAMISQSVSSILLADERQSTTTADQACTKICALLPSVSSLAFSSTRLVSALVKQEDIDVENDAAAVLPTVAPLLISICDRLDVLFNIALDADELPSSLIDVCTRALPQLLGALQAVGLRHRLHFTLLPDLQSLTRDVPPPVLLSMLRAFSKVGVWNNRSLAPVCRRIEISMGGEQNNSSLRTSVQLLFNMVRSGLVTESMLQSEDDPVGKLVFATVNTIDASLRNESISISDRTAAAALALQPLVELGMFEATLPMVANMVWASIETVHAPEVFTALAGSLRYGGGPTGAFTTFLKSMKAQKMLNSLKPYSAEVIAYCLRHAAHEKQFEECEMKEIISHLWQSANAFQNSGSLPQYISFLHNMTLLGNQNGMASAHTESVSQFLFWGVSRFRESRIPASHFGMLCASLAASDGEAACRWKEHLAETHQNQDADACAALLLLTDDAERAQELYQEVVARRKRLTPQGCVWVLNSLRERGPSRDNVQMLAPDISLKARAAVTAVQIIVSTPFAEALEGRFVSKGSGLYPPDSLLGMLGDVDMKAVEVHVGKPMHSSLLRRIDDLKRKSKRI